MDAKSAGHQQHQQQQPRSARCLLLNCEPTAESLCTSLVSAFTELGFKTTSFPFEKVNQVAEIFTGESTYIHRYDCFILYVLLNGRKNSPNCCTTITSLNGDEQMTIQEMVNSLEAFWPSNSADKKASKTDMFFFFNSSQTSPLEGIIKPYCYYATQKDRRLFLSWNSSPVNHGLQTLADLHHLCSKTPTGPSSLLASIIKETEPVLPSARLNVNVQLECRKLFLTHGANTLPSSSMRQLVTSRHQNVSQLLQQTYAMNHSNTIGRCLIIDLRISGTDQNDVQLVAELFEKLHFCVVSYKGVSDQEKFESILKAESKMDHSSLSCIVLYIFTNTNQPNLESILLGHFNDCPTLNGKPKLFFIAKQLNDLNENETMIQQEEDHCRMPNDCLVFVAAGQATTSFVDIFQRILHTHSHHYDLQTMLQMVLAQLNFGHSEEPLNCTLRSNLPKLLFLDYQTLFNFHKLNRLYDNRAEILVKHPIRRCFILDYENALQPSESESLKQLLSDYQMYRFTGLNDEQTGRLFGEEAKMVEKWNRNMEAPAKKSISVIVFCIFAQCIESDGAFKTANGKVVLLSEMIQPFLPKSYAEKATRVFFFINNRSTDYPFKSHFQLTAQISNIYLSFSTFPPSWHLTRLTHCTNPSIKPQELLLRVNSTDDLVDKLNSPSDLEMGQSSEILKLLSKLKLFSSNQRISSKSTWINICSVDVQLTRAIHQLSTNTLSTASSQPELLQHSECDLVYDMEHPHRGKCLILQISALQLELAEDLDANIDLLERTFCGLRFSVDSLAIQNVEQLEKVLQQEIYADYWNIDAWVMVFVGHSTEEGWFLCGDRLVQLHPILNLLNTLSASLRTKPKLIIVHDPYINRTRVHQPQSAPPSLHALTANQMSIPPHFTLLTSLHNYTSTPNPQAVHSASFLTLLCRTLRHLSDHHDLLTQLRLLTLLRHQHSYSTLYLKSTFSSLVFFKTNPNEAAFNSPPVYSINRNIESVNSRLCTTTTTPIKLLTKSEALFYHQGQQQSRCLILQYSATERSPNVQQISSDQILHQSDLQSLEETFRNLHFEVDSRVSQDEETSYQVLREESKRSLDHVGCLVVHIFTNGNPRAVTNRDQLVTYFTEHPSLIGKPKILFIYGHHQALGYAEQSTSSNLNTDSNSTIFRIPKYADLLLFYSAQVSASVGALVKVLTKHAHCYDLVTCLGLVAEEMTTKQSKSEPPPFINSTLTRLVSLSQPPLDADSYSTSPLAVYLPVSSRGICIIFNYEHFQHPTNKTRLGTGVDVDALICIFTQMNFTIDRLPDSMTRLQTIQALKGIARANYSFYSSLALCFLSHGEDGGILHTYDAPIRRNDLPKYLTLNRTLDGKPKLLFLQACQGKSRDSGLLATDSPNSTTTPTPPAQSDLFIFSSSYPGHYSYRNESTGSWFIQALCHQLTAHRAKYDLATIATKVCQMVGHRRESVHGEKQIPFLYSTLTRPLRLDG